MSASDRITSIETPTHTARRIGLVLALGGLLVVVDTTVTTVAIAPVVRDLDSTLPTIQWITTGYLLAVVAVIPMAAWTANRFEERRTYLGALSLFTLSSVLVALAWDPISLIVFRVVQGLGGGLLNPVGMSLGLRAVARPHRGRMMSLLGLPVVIGPVLGPPLAGLLIDAASWRWIFAINLPLGLLAIVLCRWILPAGDPSDTEPGPRRLDWRGLTQLSAGAVLLILGCSLLGQAGHLTPTSAAVLLAGVTLLVTFTVSALRAARPIVDLRLLRHRPLATGAVVLICFGAAYFGSLAILPIYVQAVRGDSAALAGTLTIPMGLAVGATLQITTRLVDRIHPSWIVLAGTGLGTAGCLALLWATTSQASYVMIGAATVILGVGSGATLMPTMAVALRDLEGPDTPNGTTLLALLQQLAAGIGVAVVATVLTILVTTRAPALHGGGIDAILALPTDRRTQLADSLSSAVGGAYLVGVVLAALSLLAALIGLHRGHRHPKQSNSETEPEEQARTGSRAIRQ